MIKDQILLLLTGIACAAAAWAFFYYTQQWAFPLLIGAFAAGSIAAAINRNRASRHESNR
jgi:hypothetical protein